MRLNLGCGHLPLDKYVNVDLYADEADIKGDIRELDFDDVEGVNMDHVLEHLPWRDSVAIMQRVRGWMRPGARIRVEVPDMSAILAAPGVNWLQWIYGGQEHEGEVHRAGFTPESLRQTLVSAGFSDVHTSSFYSEHEARAALPCIEATARA